MNPHRTHKKNLIVRRYMKQYGVRQADLAKAMYVSEQEICFALKYELDPGEQMMFIEEVKRVGHKKGDEVNG